ncbi:MAG: hypothetical protein LIP77_05645 [Planctomycetes bacterium]|nr:hypothetical protein [Planctomycetota bacterium]
MKHILVAVLLLGAVGLAGAEEVTMLPNRMAVSAVGEWVEFSLPDGYIQRHTVAERNGEGPEAEVIIRVDNIYDGEVVESSTVTETAGEPETAPPVPSDTSVTLRCYPDTFSIRGAEYEGVAVEVSRDGEPYQIWYVSPDIPVYGLGKRENLNDDGSFEIAGFGLE